LAFVDVVTASYTARGSVFVPFVPGVYTDRPWFTSTA
jgi:hypothetical protein